jgi:hemerythrin-like domain-containing protein
MAHYSLFSRWSFGVKPADVWALVGDIERWTTWWPGAREVRRVGGPPDGGVGAVHRVELRAKLPYSIVCDAELTARSREELLAFRLTSGDLRGEVTFRLGAAGDRTVVRYMQRVETLRPWMHHADPVARPLFVWNHEVLMREGAAGLARALGGVAFEERSGAAANLDVFLLIHDAMRREALHFVEVARGPLTAQAVAALRRRFERFEALTSEHHRAEDALFFPWLEKLVPALATETPTLEKDHAELLSACSFVGLALSQLKRAPESGAGRAALLDAATKLHALVQLHLEREEALVVPAVDDFATEADLAPVEREMLKRMRFSDLEILMPWVMDGVAPERERAVLSKIPAPLVALYRARWKPRYLAHR